MSKIINQSALDPTVRRAIQAVSGRVGSVAATVGDLPPSAPEGSLGFSQATKMLYIYVGGVWVAVVGAWA